MKSPSNAERLLKIRVTEDESNPCGTHDTTWVEVVYNMPNGKIQDRVQAALKMAETLKVGIDTVRVSFVTMLTRLVLTISTTPFTGPGL